MNTPAYLYEHGIKPLVEKALGVQMLREDRAGESEFVTISYWESVEAMSRFAGDDPRRIHHLERDAEFLIELPSGVQVLGHTPAGHARQPAGTPRGSGQGAAHARAPAASAPPRSSSFRHRRAIHAPTNWVRPSPLFRRIADRRLDPGTNKHGECIPGTQ
jgi:hypothetical protein